MFRAFNKVCEKLHQELQNTGKSEISLTDTDARLMGVGTSVEICYNVQTSVDGKHNLILDVKATDSPTDVGELDNRALRAKILYGGADFKVLADKGTIKLMTLSGVMKVASLHSWPSKIIPMEPGTKITT